MGSPRPTDGPREFKSCSVAVWAPSSANAITFDWRTGELHKVNWKDCKRQLLSLVKSRCSSNEPAAAPWAGKGGQSFERAQKLRLELTFFTSSVGFAKVKEKKWLVVTRSNICFRWNCDLAPASTATTAP